MDEQKIYRDALAAWGPDAQTLMAFEEMAELQKELCKAARGRQNAAQIAEEIADVEIMLEQMKILHKCAATVAEQKARKLERLAERLKNTTPRPAVDNLEFLRAVMEGRVPVPEGTVFNVNVTTTGGPEVKTGPEAVTLGPGETMRMEWTNPAGPGKSTAEDPRALVIAMADGEEVKLYTLDEAYQLAQTIQQTAARLWPEALGASAAAEWKELKPGTEINLGGRISAEELIKKTVAATFKAWTQTAKDGGCIVLPPEEVAQDGQGEQTEGG